MTRTYSIDEVKEVTGGRRRAAVDELVSMPPTDQRDGDRLTPLAAAAIGAVLVLRALTRKPRGDG